MHACTLAAKTIGYSILKHHTFTFRASAHNKIVSWSSRSNTFEPKNVKNAAFSTLFLP